MMFSNQHEPQRPQENALQKQRNGNDMRASFSNISEFLTKFIPVRSNFTLFKFQDSGFLLVFHFNGHLCHQKSLLPRQSYIFCSPSDGSKFHYFCLLPILKLLTCFSIYFIPQIWQLMK